MKPVVIFMIKELACISVIGVLQGACMASMGYLLFGADEERKITICFACIAIVTGWATIVIRSKRGK